MRENFLQPFYFRKKSLFIYEYVPQLQLMKVNKLHLIHSQK